MADPVLERLRDAWEVAVGSLSTLVIASRVDPTLRGVVANVEAFVNEGEYLLGRLVRAEAAQDALTPYARHSGTCCLYQIKPERQRCTCGYDAALEQSAAAVRLRGEPR